MADTFGDVWRRVRLQAPESPLGLIRTWTQNAYTTLAERRPWVWSRVEYHLQTLTARNLVVTFAAGSKAITSAGLFVPGTDPGRQIRVGTFPVYTIVSVESASAATLDLPFTGATAGALTAQILSAYATMPADFGAFEIVLDLTNQRQIAWWYTQEDLARVDPTRTSSDATPRVLVARKLSSAVASLGQMQYEWWPYPTTARAFPAYYRRRPVALADADPLPGVLGEAGSVLETGALMLCARWPGTSDQKNPYFSLGLYKELKDDFEKECAKLELRDDDQAQQSWSVLPYHRWAAWDLASDTSYLRSSDATVGDYIGSGLF